MKTKSTKAQATGFKKILSSDLFWMMLVIGIIRLVYYSQLFAIPDQDSPSYMNYKGDLFHGQIDVYRTPIYPYFIKAIAVFAPNNIIPAVATVQCVISFLSIILVYRIAEAVFRNRNIVRITTLLYGVMFPIINFDMIVRTEPLAVILVIVMIYLLVKYFKAPANRLAITIPLLCFVGVMLRPSFLALLPAVMLFWVLRYICIRAERKYCISGLAACLGVILLIFGYCKINKVENRYDGISSVKVINQLNILILADLYHNGNDPEFTNAVTEALKQTRSKDGTLDALQRLTINYSIERVDKFNSVCVKNNFKAYVAHIYHTFTFIKQYNMFTDYGKHKPSAITTAIQSIGSFVFYITFNLLYIFLAFNLIWLIVQAFWYKKIRWFKMIIFLLAAAQVAVAIIGAQDEYQRLIIPALPCIIMLFFSYIDELVCALDARKHEQYLSDGLA